MVNKSKKRSGLLLSLLGLFLIILTSSFLIFQKNNDADLVVCGDGQVMLINSAKSVNKPYVTWSWDIKEASELPAGYQKWLFPLDDCKPVMNAKALLLTSSGGGVVLLDIKSRKPLFYARVPMAHSATMLPGGKIAVALSTDVAGNSIELYDIHHPEQLLFKDSLFSGHGVVWNEHYKFLFALGAKELRAYSLVNIKSLSPRLELKHSWPIPSNGGHDLSMIDKDNLLLTVHKNVFKFNIPDGRFEAFGLLKDAHDIKSINFNPLTSRLLFTRAEESWWTHHIYLRSPDQVIEIPDIRLYKARFFPK